MSKVTLWAILASLAFVGGCTDAGLSGGKTESRLFALDTSGSAKDAKNQFGRRLRDELVATPLDVHVEVFRFDSSPAEVFSGPPPDTAERATALIKKVNEHDSATPGTDMHRLVQLMDGRLREVPTPAEVVIYTDCGYELMSAEKRRDTADLAAVWLRDRRVSRVRLVGVEDGHREELRRMFPIADKLSFQ